ncbi:hypothetical protein IT072_03610 [Leifsonia sp. ZF2019]|uniref:hypothetical protein n=1 Tax=Leifsonia sp. ZF2019 TaxID=2781978 RepID=UPI001CC1316B|nr:hypothetical protein [Leifsonia sp. ZF2019]UAJ80145.1 hypothetical protein IT072_03610 [Leifsonia sp. ZF2019]
MPGVTNYPALTNGSGMEGPAQIVAQSQHWDDIENRSYATANDFPSAASTYSGRLVYARDTDTFYINDNGSWVPIGQATQLSSISSFANGYGAGLTNRLSRRNGSVTLALQFNRGTNPLVATGPIFTLPPGFRPVAQHVAVGSLTTGGSPGVMNCIFNTDGTMNILWVSSTASAVGWIDTTFDAV